MNGQSPIDVVLVEDDRALLDATGQTLSLEGMRVQSFGDAASALRVLTPDFAGVVVSDVRMPGMDGLAFFARLRALDPDLPMILTTAHGDVAMAVEAMKLGAADFLAKPYSSVDLVRSVRQAAGRRALVLENRRLRGELDRRAGTTIAGESDAAAKLRSVIEALAPSEIDVVIDGAVGTGKSFVARLIHDLSQRAGRPFVAIDAGILAHEDADLLLFGREPSAGLSRTGLIERAHGGTLFLDEPEVAPAPVHSRLLSMLDSRSILPLGADRPRKLNLRIVLARSPLAPAQASGERIPLEQRLGAVRVVLPSLAERRADIAGLFRRFVSQHARELQVEPRELDEAVLRHIQTHDWPGNLRELSGFARAFVLGVETATVPVNAAANGRSLQEVVAGFERSVLEDALRRCGGNVTAVQAQLSTPRKTLYDKLARYGLKPERFRQGQTGR